MRKPITTGVWQHFIRWVHHILWACLSVSAVYSLLRPRKLYDVLGIWPGGAESRIRCIQKKSEAKYLSVLHKPLLIKLLSQLVEVGIPKNLALF